MTKSGINTTDHSETILIVEDDRDQVKFMANYLTRGGFNVLTAENGREALERANLEGPDIILLDVMLPQLDGFEVCRRLKRHPITRDIPIIFMTALTDTVNKLRGFELGAVDFIIKPFHVEEFMARLNAHLTIRRMQKQLQAQNEQLQAENEQRRRVQDALKESRERYRLLAENSTDIIARQTPQGIYRYVSPACRLVLGYEIEEMVGRSFYDFFHPEDLAAWQANNENLPDRPLVETLTYRARRKDGDYIWLETTNRLIRDPHSGLALEIIGVSRDITERKEAQKALQQAHDELEQRVADRTADLAKLNSAYERFVPHEFLKFLERDSITEVELGDQVQREMTILFSDIRSFTTLSERMTPQENFNFLNTYLGWISPVIREHNGFIDKYIGDALMALFPEQAEDALQAAIAMLQSVSRYNDRYRRRGYPPIKIGIGLHTGSLMLGTIGESQRMESTVISDAVNLASRIEGLTKAYGASIMISESALFSLSDPVKYTFRFLDRVTVKGKREPVSIFEILDGNPPAVMDLRKRTLPHFERALLYYHNQEFEPAAGYFKEVLALDPGDKAAQLYMQRIESFRTPRPEWAGRPVWPEA